MPCNCQDVAEKGKQKVEESLAMRLVQDTRKQSKRWFIAWLVTFLALLSVLGGIIYVVLTSDIAVVNFTGNIAIATGGTVEPISIALSVNGEALGNSTATVTPAAIGNFFNVSATTFVEIPCGCCVNVSIKNVSATTAIDLTNANILFERIA